MNGPQIIGAHQQRAQPGIRRKPRCHKGGLGLLNAADGDGLPAANRVKQPVQRGGGGGVQ